MSDCGEFHVKLTVPRLAFVEDAFASILVTVQDGTCSSKNITGIKCILTETSSYNRSKGSSSTTVHLGRVMNYPINPTENAKSDSPLLSAKNPLEVVVSLHFARPDLSTSILSVEHAILLQIEHRVQLPGGAYKNVLASFGLHQPGGNVATAAGGIAASGSAGSTGAPGSKKMFDEQLDIIVPHRQFFFRDVKKGVISSSLTPASPPASGTVQTNSALVAVPMNPAMVELTTGYRSQPSPTPSAAAATTVPGPSARHQIDFEARLLAHQQMSSRRSPQPPASVAGSTLSRGFQHSPTVSTFASSNSHASAVPSLAASTAPSIAATDTLLPPLSPLSSAQSVHNIPETSSDETTDPDLVSILMDAQLIVPIRVVHAAHPDDEAMMAIAPVESSAPVAPSLTPPHIFAGSQFGAPIHPGSQAIAAYKQMYPHNPHIFPGSVPVTSPSPFYHSQASSSSFSSTSSVLAKHPSLNLPYQTSSGVASSAASTYSSYGGAHPSLPRGQGGYPAYAASTSSYNGKGPWSPQEFSQPPHHPTAWASDAAPASVAARRTPVSPTPALNLMTKVPAVGISTSSSASPSGPLQKVGKQPVEDEVVVHEPVETPYVCISGYEPTGTCEDGEELRIKPGEHVIVSDIFDDGWAVGTNLNTSTAGFFLVSKITFDRTLADPSSRMGSALRLDEDDDEEKPLGSVSPSCSPDELPTSPQAPHQPIPETAPVMVSSIPSSMYPVSSYSPALMSTLASLAPSTLVALGTSPPPPAPIVDMKPHAMTADVSSDVRAGKRMTVEPALTIPNVNVPAPLLDAQQKMMLMQQAVSVPNVDVAEVDRQKVVLLQAQIEQMRMMMERMEASLKMATENIQNIPEGMSLDGEM
ncbi:hypothetical protein HDU67_009977 [Dinochytrium kinnereticum]|nr:hypothetical protein HDU67_009977 [Dinochytrium kinnereticum]